MKLKTFKVRGAGPFPYDMLRYDMCWPAHETDSALLQHHVLETRTVRLDTLSGNEQTSMRWTSFGWQVLA